MLLRRNRTGDRDRAVALHEPLDVAPEAGMGKMQADAEWLLAGVVRA